MAHRRGAPCANLAKENQPLFRPQKSVGFDAIPFKDA
jgi:hypothetical protein